VSPERWTDNVTDEFLARMTARLRDRTGVDIALAGRVHPRTKQLTIRFADGIHTERFLGLNVAPGTGVGGRVVALGRHVRVDHGGVPVRIGTGEPVSSVLAMPLHIDGQVRYVFYVAERAKKPISAQMAATALSFMRELEAFVAQSARKREADTSRRWNLDERVIRQIDSELTRLSMDFAGSPVTARIATIRTLLEDSVSRGAPVAEKVKLSLTRREITVLELVAEGLSNAEAAERLFVSPETVKACLRTIRLKLGVHNRTAAVHVARRAGLLQ
jgi:LuxR family transcriptional regulator, regulator of acetate metabolism